MAVITRKSLQDKTAIKIKDQALSMASIYNPTVVSQLQQQQALLSGQQQNMLNASQRTIGDINSQIYQSQRRQRAESASAGLIGAVSSGREATNLQSQISYELGNIVTQAEQGAVSLASQQSALNQAEVTIAQNEILTLYADELIESGDPAVQQDVAGQVIAGLQGALAGGLAGLGLGAIGPKVTSLAFTKGVGTSALIGGGLGLGGSALINQIASIGDDYKPDGWKIEDQDESVQGLVTAGSIAGGVTIGAGLRKLSSRTAAFQKGFWTNKIGAKKGIQSFGRVSKLGALGRRLVPSPLTLALGAAGAIIGGLSAGLDKKYKLDYDKLIQSGTAKDFASMGVDLTALTALIAGK